MDWQAISGSLVAVGTLVGGTRQFTRKNERLRGRIERDIALLGHLPADSVGAKNLTTHIDESVRDLVALQEDQAERRTDPYGLIWMVIFISVAIGLAVFAIRTDHSTWVDIVLWLVVALFAFITLLGATVTFRQKPKTDEKAEKKG
jgi:hypothetical protein